MTNKSELAQRAQAELTAAADGFERAGALFRTIFTALIQCGEPPTPDILSLLRTGSSLCDSYAGRADDEGGYFEDISFSSPERHAEDSSQGGA
jgi:hypothetical protein